MLQEAKRKRGRPHGWRKRPQEKPWISIGVYLPPDVHRWLKLNRQILINMARGVNENEPEWFD